MDPILRRKIMLEQQLQQQLEREERHQKKEKAKIILYEKVSHDHDGIEQMIIDAFNVGAYGFSYFISNHPLFENRIGCVFCPVTNTKDDYHSFFYNQEYHQKYSLLEIEQAIQKRCDYWKHKYPQFISCVKFASRGTQEFENNFYFQYECGIYFDLFPPPLPRQSRKSKYYQKRNCSIQ